MLKRNMPKTKSFPGRRLPGEKQVLWRSLNHPQGTLFFHCPTGIKTTLTCSFGREEQDIGGFAFALLKG